MTEINFGLLSELAGKAHPLLNPKVCDCHHWCGEINQEAKVSHHLLDMVKIPHGTNYAQNLDARTYQAVMRIFDLEDRLFRISAWHKRTVLPGGLFDHVCCECGEPWPCDTHKMANGSYVDPA
jgi:hypothetical protein